MKKMAIWPLATLLVLALSACPDASKNGPGPRTGPAERPRPQANVEAELLSSPRTVKVAALYYKKDGDGGASTVRITVGPNEDRVAEVGVREQWIGGTGGQMKSSVWVAAFMASMALGRELVDYSFSASTTGFVDGPSAGALFTAAMMAAITGATVNPRATMTGTVNPDGSVGPVGGIPDKFRGALKLGYKVLGYPVGQRVQKDAQGNLVDLEEIASQGDARAYPIATMYDAYRLLTGQNPPTRFVVKREAMRLSPDAGTYLIKQAQSWSAVQAKFKSLFVQRRIANKDALDKMMISQRYMESASKRASQNQAASAYEFASRGASFAFTTFHYQDFLIRIQEAIKSKDSEPIRKKAQAVFAGSVASKATFERIRKLPQPVSVDQAVAQIGAYSLALENIAYLEGAAELYRFASIVKQKMQGQLSVLEANMLSRSITYMGVAQSKAMKAGHLVGLASPKGRPFRLSGQRLQSISSQLSQMALANLAYCDTVIIDNLVHRTKQPKEYFQLTLTNYLAAAKNARVSLTMNRVLNKGSWQWSLAELGAALSSYLHSSMMLTKMYAVGAFAQMGGQVQKVEREQALLEMLRHADESARQAAARAQKATGSVPHLSRFFYEVAAAMRESGQTMQVKALEMYWRSSLLSQLAVMLSRGA